MNITSPEIRDLLAAEYVLGTMTYKTRQRFERLLKEDIFLNRAVEDWQKRLTPLADAVSPIKPPAKVWRNVKKDVRKQREKGLSFWQKLVFWRGLGLAASVAAIFFVVQSLITPAIQATPQFVALFEDQQATPAWYLQVDQKTQRIIVKTLSAPDIEITKVHELWLLPAGGKAPESLGLLPDKGQKKLVIPASRLTQFSTATGLAISVEPAGGSPTGLPTGPVIMQAKIISL